MLINQNESEINNLLIQKQNEKRSPQTIDKYRKQYAFLTEYFDEVDDWIIGTSENKLIQGIKNMDIGATGKNNYLSLISLIRGLYSKSTDKITSTRTQLFTEIKKNTENKIEIKKSLPSHEEITQFVNGLYKLKDYRRYIYNFLILEYGLRNRDVNMFIITKDEYAEIKKNPQLEKTSNWIVIYKNEIVLVINQYKTMSFHGTKTIKARSRKLFKAVNEIGRGWLIVDKNGNELDDVNMSYYIKLYDLNNEKLTQADYFKASIKYLQSQPNSLHKIAEICQTRGTNTISVIDNNYNIDK
jgi:hypothetical protein